MYLHDTMLTREFWYLLPFWGAKFLHFDLPLLLIKFWPNLLVSLVTKLSLSLFPDCSLGLIFSLKTFNYPRPNLIGSSFLGMDNVSSNWPSFSFYLYPVFDPIQSAPLRCRFDWWTLRLIYSWVIKYELSYMEATKIKIANNCHYIDLIKEHMGNKATASMWTSIIRYSKGRS